MQACLVQGFNISKGVIASSDSSPTNIFLIFVPSICSTLSPLAWQIIQPNLLKNILFITVEYIFLLENMLFYQYFNRFSCYSADIIRPTRTMVYVYTFHISFAEKIRRGIYNTHSEIFLKSYQINPKSDCIYQFPINLESNGRLFGSKSIGKW